MTPVTTFEKKAVQARRSILLPEAVIGTLAMEFLGLHM